MALPVRNRASSPTPFSTEQRSAQTGGSPAGGSPTSSSQPTQTVPLKNLWIEAFQNLDEKCRKAIPQPSANGTVDIDYLCSLTLEKRARCEEKRWKFQLGKREIILRDIADKVIVWLHKFKEVGDVAANYDTAHASLPWAAVRFLLQAAVADKDQMAALLIGVEKVTHLMNRCSIYEILYRRNTQLGQALVNLENELIKLYCIVLEFLARASRLFDKSTAARAFHAILKPESISSFISNCEAQENSVEKDVRNCERKCSNTAYTGLDHNLKDLQQTLKHLLNDLNRPILRVDSRVANLWERGNETERHELLLWLSEVRYEENHHTARHGRTPGTGEWILMHNIYQEWRCSSTSLILWLSGIPGAGKTKLASKVIDSVLDDLDNRPNDEAIAYFYCDRNQTQRQSPEEVLRSFVRQLAADRAGEAIQTSIVKLYRQRKTKGFASGQLRIDESEEILLDLVNIYPQTTLVIDALDECDRRTRERLMDVLDNVVKKSAKPVKILISSRSDLDIKEQYEDGPHVEIQATDNKNDIRTFVAKSIDSQRGKRYEIFKEDILREDIIQVMQEKSEGMFQWAALQMTQLFELQRKSDIRDRLGKLPKDLEQAYAEMYDKIRAKPGSAPAIADRAFQWILCSREPMSAALLVAAVHQDPGQPCVTKLDDDVNIDFILDACYNLLVVDKKLDQCRFSHLSVQEYLESHIWKQREANCFVAKVCLTVLNDLTMIERCSKPSNAETPFFLDDRVPKKSEEDPLDGLIHYSCDYWAIHVHLQDEGSIDDRLVTLLKQFFGSMNESGAAYRRWYDRTREEWKYRTTYDPTHLRPASSALLAMCFFGLYRMLKDWWDSSVSDVNQRNEVGMSLLQITLLGKYDWYHSEAEVKETMSSKYCAIAEMLLRSGADVNAARKQRNTPLALAAFYEDEWTIRLLLSAGADVNIQGGDYGSALSAAAYRGKENIVQLLLSAGAEVNIQGGKYGSALGAAAYGRDGDAVQLLLSAGADVNMRGGEYGSPLQAAAAERKTAAVRLLLKHGADARASGYRGSALAWAKHNEDEEMERLLLECGADPTDWLVILPEYENSEETGESVVLETRRRGWRLRKRRLRRLRFYEESDE